MTYTAKEKFLKASSLIKIVINGVGFTQERI